MINKDNCLTLIGLNAAQFSELNAKIQKEKINVKFNTQLDFFQDAKKPHCTYVPVCGIQWSIETIRTVNEVLKTCDIPYMLFTQTNLDAS